MDSVEDNIGSLHLLTKKQGSQQGRHKCTAPTRQNLSDRNYNRAIKIWPLPWLHRAIIAQVDTHSQKLSCNLNCINQPLKRG